MSSLSAKILALAIMTALALALGGAAHPVAAQGTGSITGTVFHDLDVDGVLDPREPRMAGWLVKLERYDSEEPLLEEVKTDRDGRYSFEDLPAGEYGIDLPCEGQPRLWGGTVNETTGWGLTLETGADMKGIDFPVIPLRSASAQPHSGTIAGRLVWDEDRDAVAEPREPGIAGREVTVYREDEPVCFPEVAPSVYSGPDGQFRFSGLAPGLYQVDPYFADQTVQRNLVIDTPGSTVREGDYDRFETSFEVEVPARGTANIAIGVISLDGTGSISGGVYADRNENGIRDPDDPFEGRDSWVALFYRTPGGYSRFPCALQSPLPGGRYEFSGLAAGDYLVGVAFGPGRPINPPGGPNDGPYFPLTLADGERRTGVDFGFAFQPSEPTPASTPTPDVRFTPPVTGSASAPPDSGLVGFATALAVAGSLAVAASALAIRRKGHLRR